MNTIKNQSKLLVEQILNGNLLDAGTTLSSLISEAEKQRELKIQSIILEDESDDASAETAEAEDDSETTEGDESTEGNDEEINTDSIDEPTDGDPSLGDNLESGVEDESSVSEGEMTEISNDIVEITCEVNQKLISKLYDKISNLKTKLNGKDLDHDTREYITLETKLSYYGNKLEELQSKTNPAIDQSKVEERITKIDAALKSLETEIGGTEVDDVDPSSEEADTESVDDLGDDAESSVKENEEAEDDSESESESEQETNESEESDDESTQETDEETESDANTEENN